MMNMKGLSKCLGNEWLEDKGFETVSCSQYSEMFQIHR